MDATHAGIEHRCVRFGPSRSVAPAQCVAVPANLLRSDPKVILVKIRTCGYHRLAIACQRRTNDIHLLQHARDVERLRHYVCQCGTPVENRAVAMKRLNAWLQSQPPQPDATGWFKFHKAKKDSPSIVCVECMKQVSLWDEMEQCFASPEIQQRVRDMQEESKIVLDNESKERAGG